MNEYEEIEKVKAFILKHKSPAFFTTNKKELRVRCPYCGDSKSNKTHAHLYIQMKPPFKFYCHKCNTGGSLNSKTMRDFQLYDSDISISLTTLAKMQKDKQGYSITTFKKKDFQFPILEDSQSYVNRDYFNSRFGTNFSIEEITNRFKAVMSPLEFFRVNNLLVPFGQYDLTNAIGFLSADHSHIVFRDTSGQQRKRYYNYSIYPDSEEDTNKFYSLKTEVDFLSPSIKIVLTEGIFDIIGVYSHFYNGINRNIIYSAACGKGFNTVISNYIHKGFLNFEVEIYSDSDVPILFYKNLKESSPYLKREPITIFYNEIGKDYGVPKDQIKLRKVVL